MAVGTVGNLTSEAEKFKCDSNEAVFIKLVQNEEDVLKDDNTFHPWMSHQVFGESETIFGYKDLQVKLYYHAGSLLTYLNMECKAKIPPSFGIKADPVLPNIADIIPEGFISNLDEFIRKLPEESSFTPMGHKLHSYKHKEDEFEIYQADISVPRLKDYHERLQTFVLWYIDAASFIDVDDEKWNFFLLFKKKKIGSRLEYAIAGYMTVYHHFSYPDKYRPRISQMLVLPPYQRAGHGTKFLETVNQYYISQPKATDITVEDPSEDFVRRRDCIDCKNCMLLNEFQKEHLVKGFSPNMSKAALEKYKISKQQARRVYEILRLRVTDTKDEKKYTEYRLDIKNRLNIPYQKQARDMKKLQAVLSPDEYNAAFVGQTHDERIERLDEAFKQLEEEYLKVIAHLNAT